MPKTVNPDPAWTDTLSVPLPHETMDADDVAVPDTRLLANDKWLRREFGARLDALERAVWPTSVQANLTATETDSAAHVWRFEYSLSTSRGTITSATLDYGDGSPALTLSNPGTPGAVTHDYPDTGGTYTAVLRVTTSEGAQQTVERTVTVATPVTTQPEPSGPPATDLTLFNRLTRVHRDDNDANGATDSVTDIPAALPITLDYQSSPLVYDGLGLYFDPNHAVWSGATAASQYKLTLLLVAGAQAPVLNALGTQTFNGRFGTRFTAEADGRFSVTIPHDYFTTGEVKFAASISPYGSAITIEEIYFERL